MKKCLIIDDSPVVRKVAKLIIEQIAFHAAEAESTEQALEICQKRMPDLILLDWQTAGLGAHDFLAALAKIHADKRPQILYSTTEVDAGDIGLAFSEGISDYILKPFDRASLQSKIASLPAAA